VDGTTLRGWLRERTRGWRAIVVRFVEAGLGLSAAHAAGLVHRDFKPENVLVGRDGRGRVADFGLARVAGRAGPAATGTGTGARTGPGAATVTQTGSVLGTPAYMAPEQREGQSDARSDQYSFCVALYEALHGALPSQAGTKGGAVPPWLDEVVARGMRAEP